MTDRLSLLNFSANSTMTSLMSSSNNSTPLAASTGEMLNQTSDVPVTPEMTSITPMTIAAVSIIMVISSVAVVMNSGILVLTYWLKLINKDYRMIYYVLITATDLAFSVHSIINCVTIIFRNVEFFKYKLFCLILQCSGTVSYQISAMSIILLIFDLVFSIRNPFSTETSLRKRLSYLACFVAIFIAISLAYGPFIWWYGSETKLDFCSIANVYGPHFTDYHKMATVVLALLFVLMVVASSLLLKQIKSSITPRRLRSFKIPSIFKHDPESKLERTRESSRRNALHDNEITCDQVKHSDGQSKEMVHGSTLPDVVAGVEKITTSLSNYVGIDNIAFDKAERISIRNKLLNIDTNPDMDTFPNNGAATKEQHDRKDSNASRNRYTDAYKYVVGIETEMSLSVTSIQNSEQRPNTDGNATTALQKLEYLNHGFDDADIENTVTEEMKEREPTANMVPEAAATNGQIDDTTVDNQRLSVDVETAYRGSKDKVRRLTGTEPVGPEIKEILNERSEKRKKFLRACTTVAAFMTAYLGCGLPYYILSVIELSQGTATEDSVERRTVRMICAIFLYLLPIIDPILYTSRFVIVRQTLGRVVPRCCRCRKQNDT